MSNVGLKRLCDLVARLNDISAAMTGIPVEEQVDLGYQDIAAKLQIEIVLTARELGIDQDTKDKLVQHADWSPKVQAISTYLSENNPGGRGVWGCNTLDLALELLKKFDAEAKPSNELTVSANSLRHVLNALNGPGHLIRELQATRLLPGGTNPIDQLVNEYNTWADAQREGVAQ